MKKFLKIILSVALAAALLFIAYTYTKIQHIPHMGENLCAISGCNGEICYDPLTSSGGMSNCMPIMDPNRQCRLSNSKCARATMFGACGWVPKDPATFTTDVEMCVR